MLQPITLITAGIFLAMLYLRFRSQKLTQPKDAPRRTRQQKLKFAKLLFGALAAWMAIHYSLQHTIAKIDGADTEPSMMERLVSFLNK